jgi:hypothetical protein
MVLVTQPDDGQVTDPPFSRSPQSPTGIEFYVQAVPVFRFGGPVLLGTRDEILTHGLLGLLNRFLGRSTSMRHDNGFAAFVYRDHPGGPIVAESEHRTMREAREAAMAFVQSIEDGTLSGI